jgi:simple sugar transport system permease protein
MQFVVVNFSAIDILEYCLLNLKKREDIVLSRNILGRIFSYKVSFTLIVFVMLLLIFIFFTPQHSFIKVNNLGALGKLTPDLGIVALGVGMLMISGEFDLSVGSIIPMSSFIFVKFLEWGAPLIVLVFITLATGALMGFFNGLLVVRGRLPSFIATLGTMMFWRGILYVGCRMMPIGIRAYLERGSWLEKLLTGSIGGSFPVQILWLLFFSILLGLLLHFHTFGNWVFVTGDNRTAARAMGINTGRVKTVCFIIVGLLCSFMSMMQSLRIESFAATQGIGFELKAIASAVVGGTSLLGGIGSIPGIFLGTLTIQIMENGLILMGAPVFGINAFIGVGIILFAVLNVYITRYSTR